MPLAQSVNNLPAFLNSGYGDNLRTGSGIGMAAVKPTGYDRAIPMENYNAPTAGSFRSNFYNAMQSKMSQVMAQ